MREAAKFNADSSGLTRAAAGLSASSLSSRRLLVFVLMAAVFTMTAGQITDPDFWWHLRTGQFIVETRTIPHADVFSHTALGREWVTHEWLAEALMFALYGLAGWAGLVAAFAAVMTAAFWVSYRRCARAAPHPYVAGSAILLGALATGPIWGVRPQMLSFLFTSVYVAVLGDYVREERRTIPWWLVPLMLVWVNVHGGFALGLALVALTMIGVVLDGLLRREAVKGLWRRLRPLCVLLAACALVVPLNPSGLRLFSYPLETLNSHAMHRYIDEWLTPNFHLLTAHGFAALLFATFAALALSPKRARAGEIFLLCVAAYGALRAWRNIPFFALVAMPMLAEHAWAFCASQSWGRWLLAPERREVGAHAATTLALNAALLVCLPTGLALARVVRVVEQQPASEAEQYPAAAVEFLRGQEQAGPIYNYYGWGGYLIWKLYPQRPVYIDGRADVYGDAFVEEYLRAEGGGRDWRALLERDGVRTVMIGPDVPLASLLREDGGWRVGYEDRQAVIFFKR